jgi:hypothetical protein
MHHHLFEQLILVLVCVLADIMNTSFPWFVLRSSVCFSRFGLPLFQAAVYYCWFSLFCTSICWFHFITELGQTFHHKGSTSHVTHNTSHISFCLHNTHLTHLGQVFAAEGVRFHSQHTRHLT